MALIARILRLIGFYAPFHLFLLKMHHIYINFTLKSGMDSETKGEWGIDAHRPKNGVIQSISIISIEKRTYFLHRETSIFKSYMMT